MILLILQGHMAYRTACKSPDTILCAVLDSGKTGNVLICDVIETVQHVSPVFGYRIRPGHI
jgi:hypothetical protein